MRLLPHASLTGLLIALATTIAFSAHAEPDPRASELHELHDYAGARRGESAGLVGIGAASLAIGGASLAQDSPMYDGIAYVTLVAGIAQVAAGAVRFAGTARWESDAARALGEGDGAFAEREASRVEAARRQLRGRQVVEASLFAGGGVLAYFSSAPESERVRGIGMAIALEAATMLAFDLFASSRAARWAGNLQHVGFTVAPQPSGGVVSVAAPF